MKIYLFTILIIVCGCSYKQSKIYTTCYEIIEQNFIDSFGVEGVIDSLFKQLEHFEKMDSFQICNQYGNIIIIIEFAGTDTFKISQFYNTGELYLIGQMLNQEKFGKWIGYHNNGNKLSKGKYIDDKLNGIFKTWYEDGSIKLIEDFKNNLPHGKSLFYYSNGILGVEFYNNEGLVHGELKVWHENGQLAYIGEYYQGKEIGKWEYWTESGKLVKIEYYEDGELIKTEEF